MAFQTNSKKGKSNEKTNYEITGVQNVRKFEDGGILFTILVNGIWIHGMRIVESEKAKDGWFIAFPQRKGNDGKYYSHAYFSISDEDKAKIGELVREALAK